MEDWYFQTYKWTDEILQSSEAIACHLILRSYLSADLLKLSTAVQALSIFLFYFLTTALPWPWGALKSSWSSTLSLIDGCKTQMVNSQKCCWQILLLLEQVFCSFCLLCFFFCGSLSWSFTKCWAVTSWLRSIQAAFGSCWDGYNLIKVHCLYSHSLMESLPAHRHLYSYEFFKIAAINGMFWHNFYCKESPFKNHCDALYTYCTFYVELFIELWEFWKTGALFVEHVFQTRSIS